MPLFRKKPVEIRAERLHTRVEIETLEGVMVGEPGDWLITGVKGERYPCKDDIFRATYEPVTEAAVRELDGRWLLGGWFNEEIRKLTTKEEA